VADIERAASGLWVVGLLKHRPKKRTVTLPNGERALVTVDDSGTVTQVETAERLDAIVRPRTVTVHIRRGGDHARR
jgi:hypothetical protein